MRPSLLTDTLTQASTSIAQLLGAAPAPQAIVLPLQS